MKKPYLTLLLIALSLLLSALPLFSGGRQGSSPSPSQEIKGIRVENPWIRPSPQAGGTTAAYAKITNSSPAGDRLLAVRSPISARVELHTHMMDGDMARMRPVDSIDLPPGQTTELKPGGLHIMLMGLPNPLILGTEVELTLVFETAGEITLMVPVVSP